MPLELASPNSPVKVRTGPFPLKFFMNCTEPLHSTTAIMQVAIVNCNLLKHWQQKLFAIFDVCVNVTTCGLLLIQFTKLLIASVHHVNNLGLFEYNFSCCWRFQNATLGLHIGKHLHVIRINLGI